MALPFETRADDASAALPQKNKTSYAHDAAS
jgi:hypothetical protein